MPNNTLIKQDDLELLLKDIYHIYGYDFLNYSQSSMMRRVNRLCAIDRILSFAELRTRIINNKFYFKRFIGEVTVNVTEMFRDPLFYEVLRRDILPKISNYPFIRIWVAGCSTGEEPLSLAIMLKELNLLHKTLIYATDINPIVLEKAAKGVVPITKMRLYAENYISSGGIDDFSVYYTALYGHVQFDSKLLERITFSTHNLISDSSFNEFQLILCRNVLIYFNKKLQDRVLSLFDQSLQTSGYLGLGSKETLLFSSIEKKFTQINNSKIWKKL